MLILSQNVQNLWEMSSYTLQTKMQQTNKQASKQANNTTQHNTTQHNTTQNTKTNNKNHKPILEIPESHQSIQNTMRMRSTT